MAQSNPIPADAVMQSVKIRTDAGELRCREEGSEETQSITISRTGRIWLTRYICRGGKIVPERTWHSVPVKDAELILRRLQAFFSVPFESVPGCDTSIITITFCGADGSKYTYTASSGEVAINGKPASPYIRRKLHIKGLWLFE